MIIDKTRLDALDDWIEEMLDDQRDPNLPEYDDSISTEFTTDIRGDWT